MKETNELTSCAVLGLGLIGSAWANHLAADGVLTATWNRTPREGAPAFEPEIDLIAGKATVLHLVVSDERAATSVIDQLMPHLTARHLLIQSTTIDPETSTAIKARVERRGARYLESPFTGSLPAALERKTIFYLGGSAEVIDLAQPYLQRLSSRRIVIGSNEQACYIKLVMNLQIVSAVEALAEALTIARRGGISDQVFFDAFRENASFSGVAALKEPKLKSGDYSAQFSLKHMAKDMRLLAKSLGDKEFPALQSARKVLSLGEERGFSNEDISAIIKLLA